MFFVFSMFAPKKKKIIKRIKSEGLKRLKRLERLKRLQKLYYFGPFFCLLKTFFGLKKKDFILFFGGKSEIFPKIAKIPLIRPFKFLKRDQSNSLKETRKIPKSRPVKFPKGDP